MTTTKEFEVEEGTVKVSYSEEGAVLGVSLEPDPNYIPPAPKEGKQYVSQRTAACLLNVTEEWVKEKFYAGELTGEDLLYELFIDVASLEPFADSMNEPSTD